jgi:hypothetical protein
MSKQSWLSTTQTGALVAVLGNSTPVGFLVQRQLQDGKVVTVGRIPLGRKARGHILIRHRLIVAGRKLRPGRYLLTLRALGPNHQILALSRPVAITIRRAH